MGQNKTKMFEVIVLAWILFAAIGFAGNLHSYFTYKEAVAETEPLAQLDQGSVWRALDRMNLTSEQRDLLKRTISGDQKNIASLHEVLVGALRALQRQHGLSAVTSLGSALTFLGLFILGRRHLKP